MDMPSILQGEPLTRLVQGAAVGAFATILIGFNWGGWTLGGTAAKMSEDAAKSAVIAALAPVCVDKFQRTVNAAENLVELKKIASYRQSSFVEKGGWATPPGSDTANYAVAEACANLLSKSE
jgi:hypothetical protein